MEAPPVQYAKTEDGYNIAYAVGGEGPELVLLPVLFSNLRFDSPRDAWLRRRFRVLSYDARGLGMSTRGLRDGVSMEDYLRDLAAILPRAGFTRFALGVAYSLWRVAVRYAARHPDRVSALVVVNPDPPIESSTREHRFAAMASQAWEHYLLMTSRTYGGDVDRMKAGVTREDYLRMLRAVMEDDATPLLSSLAAPTLLIAQRQPGVAEEDSLVAVARQLAAAIPNARMMMTGDISDDPSEVFHQIEEFLLGIVAQDEGRATHAQPADGLSGREIEVLRLIAAGKSNQQIADALVISLNTVARHVSNIFDKTGAANRTEAAGYARDRGLV
jgi:DNA-binding NarL/FixJ family response regulator